MTEAKIICDSLNVATGNRLTTFVVPRLWKLLQAEVRTHRSLSQSHYSSRAIPIDKAIKQVESDPFLPHWTRYQKGMGGIDDLSPSEIDELNKSSLNLRDKAIATVCHLQTLGAAKQECNRYIEPWMYGPVILSGTSEGWKHFFELRCAEGVQPDLRAIARSMRQLYLENTPQALQPGEWAIPYKLISESLSEQDQLKVSSARCARSSYANHEGKIDVVKDIELHDRLVRDLHLTPMEHQAIALPVSERVANFVGFKQYRKYIEN